jgi:hypothetical protein
MTAAPPSPTASTRSGNANATAGRRAANACSTLIPGPPLPNVTWTTTAQAGSTSDMSSPDAAKTTERSIDNCRANNSSSSRNGSVVYEKEARVRYSADDLDHRLQNRTAEARRRRE